MTSKTDQVVAENLDGKLSVSLHLQTYYGNPLCCCWSKDGLYIAAGGEDDLVAVFSMEEQRVVAWAEGHTSWVSAVTFDAECASRHPSLLPLVCRALVGPPIMTCAAHTVRAPGMFVCV